MIGSLRNTRMMKDKNQIPNTNKAAVTTRTLIETLSQANTLKKIEKEIESEEAETDITQKEVDQSQNHQLILTAKKEIKMAEKVPMPKKKVVTKRKAEAKMMVGKIFLETKIVVMTRHLETMEPMVISTKMAVNTLKTKVKNLVKLRIKAVKI